MLHVVHCITKLDLPVLLVPLSLHPAHMSPTFFCAASGAVLNGKRTHHVKVGL